MHITKTFDSIRFGILDNPTMVYSGINSYDRWKFKYGFLSNQCNLVSKHAIYQVILH